MQNICWKSKAGRAGRALLAVVWVAQALTASAATLHVWQNSPSPAPPYATWASAATNIQDAIDAATVGDEIVVTNGVYATGGRVVYGSMTNRVVGDKPLRRESVNGPAVTLIEGRGSLGDTTVRCVYLTNGAVLAGFTLTNGGTRLAGDVEREQSGGGVWCPSTNALVTNCVLVNNSARQRGGGVHGGLLRDCTLTNNFVSYLGGGAYGSVLIDCALVDNRAFSPEDGNGGGAELSILIHCTLRGNRSGEGGGGASHSTLHHCSLLFNQAGEEGGGARACTLNYCLLAANSAPSGGGADQSTLNHCVLEGNSATTVGGGATSSDLNHCTVVGNSAGTMAGGVHGSLLFGRPRELNNCIIFYNNAPLNPNFEGMVLNFSCTTPMPTNGSGNITNAPLFSFDEEDDAPRLQSNSPCINAGHNAYVTDGLDLDGLPRIAGGTVDMGAYEFQTPASTLSYAWLLQYGLPLDGSADTGDPDSDVFNNYQEWRAGTDPTNAASLLRMLPPSPLGSNVAVTWRSVPGRSYSVERSMDLGALPHFTVLATNVPASPGETTTFTHTNAAPFGPWFYRVGVDE